MQLLIKVDNEHVTIGRSDTNIAFKLKLTKDWTKIDSDDLLDIINHLTNNIAKPRTD